MKAIKNKYTNKMLGAPSGWDEKAHGPCAGLPVCATDDPYVYSWWKPTLIERLKMAIGCPVQICIVGNSQPPIAVSVDERSAGKSAK